MIQHEISSNITNYLKFTKYKSNFHTQQQLKNIGLIKPLLTAILAELTDISQHRISHIKSKIFHKPIGNRQKTKTYWHSDFSAVDILTCL